MPVLETERLLLCKLTPNDVEFIFELLNTPAWLKFIGDRGVKNLDNARDYIITGPMFSYNKNGFGLWLTKLKDSNTPLGLCGLIKRDALEDVDIGFAFLPEYTGKGYALEAAKATMEYAKTELGLKRIVAITTQDNEHSIALLKKIGFHYEKLIKLPAEDEELMLFASKTLEPVKPVVHVSN